MLKENLVLYIEQGIKEGWDDLALSDYNGCNLKYQDVYKRIIELHKVFEYCGLEKKEKVALIGKNSTNWAVVFLATITYGAVVVPILPEFIPNDIENLVNHSEARLLFSSEAILNNLKFDELANIQVAFLLEDYSVAETKGSMFKTEDVFKSHFNGDPEKNDMSFERVENKELALISYTSGTTGNSKGVMLSHNSLAANIRFAQNNMPLKKGDSIVSFLPLAHSYGLAFEFLFPFSLGCHITFLTKTPSPQIITAAFSEIRPRLILSVPLVIEKIYKNRLLPEISKPPVKFLLKIPLINRVLLKKIRQKLETIFGGNFHEVVIGGAPFNKEAEAFFKKIRFPFTIGYGMTECGPLISYSSWKTTKMRSSGKKVDTLEVKIDSEDPQRIAGEILIKGENVMDGYYKNQEATRKAIDSDGWLHSGDLGVIDNDGCIFIKGRSKSMLLGPSGQNIYPEEIESLINNKYCVQESIVVERKGKLVALVYPDSDLMEKDGIGKEKLENIMEENRTELNKQVPAYMNVSKFLIHPEEFIKTPKRSIKRFLYS